MKGIGKEGKLEGNCRVQKGEWSGDDFWGFGEREEGKGRAKGKGQVGRKEKGNLKKRDHPQ